MGITGWAEEIKLRTQSFSNLEFISQSVGTLKLGYGFEGELLFAFSRRLGLGLSGGYSYGSLPEEDVDTVSIWDGVNYIHTKPGQDERLPGHRLGVSSFSLSGGSSTSISGPARGWSTPSSSAGRAQRNRKKRIFFIPSSRRPRPSGPPTSAGWV